MTTIRAAIGYCTVWWFYQDFLDWIDRNLTPSKGAKHG